MRTICLVATVRGFAPSLAEQSVLIRTAGARLEGLGCIEVQGVLIRTVAVACPTRGA